MATILEALAFCSGILILYGLLLVAYRLLLHPLSRFPGPKLAAATQWYEAYFDLVKHPGGQFMFEVDRLHDIYGPIVRITPHEIHVKDSTWKKVLYTSYSKGVRDKYPPAAAMAGLPNDVFGTVSQEHHHKRRTAINTFFSRASVQQVEPILHRLLDVFCDELHTRLQSDDIAKINVICLALTADTITEFGFGKGLGLLEDDHWAEDWYKTNQTLAAMIPTVRQFPWSMPLALRLPVDAIRFVNRDVARVLELRHEMRRQASHAINVYAAAESRSDNTKDAKIDKNVWTSILNSRLPPEEKTAVRMADEAFTLIAAGGETTARALCLAVFHVLENKECIMPRLLEELMSVMPEKTSYPKLRSLEKLPWLTGIVKETLRLSTIVSSRLPLIASCETLKYGEWCIPPGIPVSMSQRDSLLDPAIFSNPMKFDPSRWLPSNPDLQVLERSWTPFGRGERMCVGWQLAMAELYLILATIFRRFDLELHDTVRERDVDIARDSFLGEPSLGSKGVRVKLVSTQHDKALKVGRDEQDSAKGLS